VAFNHDGTQLATGARDKMLRVVDVASGAVLCEVEHGGQVKSVSFNHDGTSLAVADWDRCVVIGGFSADDSLLLLMRLLQLDADESVLYLAGMLEKLPRLVHKPLSLSFRGCTLLHAAIALDRIDWIPTLMARGALPFQLEMCADGKSAIDLGLHLGKFSALRVLCASKCAPHNMGSMFLTERSVHSVATLIDKGVEMGPSLFALRASPLAADAQQVVEGDLSQPLRTLVGTAGVTDYARLVSQPRLDRRAGLLEVRMCPWRGVLDKNVGLLPALANSSEDAILANPVVGAMLHHLWWTYARRAHIARWACSASVLGLHTFAHLEGAGGDWEASGNVLEKALLALSGLLLASEVLVLCKGGWASTADVFNLIDFLAPLLVFIVTATLLVDEDEPASRHAAASVGAMDSTTSTSASPKARFAVSARFPAGLPQEAVSLATLVLWLHFILYLRGFQATSALIRMVQEIFKEAVPFLVIFLLTIAGLGHAFAMSSPTERTLPDSMGLAYHFVVGGDFVADGDADNPWLIVLWYFGSLVGTIVMLNLLIALMGDAYSRVQENSVAARNRELAQIIVELDFFIPERFMRKWTTGYLHIAREKNVDREETLEWTGVIGRIVQNTDKALRKMQEQADHRHDVMMKMVSQLQDDVRAAIAKDAPPRGMADRLFNAR